MRLVESERNGVKGRLTFEVESDEEFELLQSSFARGTHWVRIDRSRQWIRFEPSKEVQIHEALEPPPPVPDPLIADYWKPGEVEERFDTGLRGGDGRSFYVSGLQAYDGRYKHRARLLEEAGFDCMRSRRGKDGRVWEHWYLPGKWSAKGPIEGNTDEQILQWLCNLGPGNITESGRTWGLAIE